MSDAEKMIRREMAFIGREIRKLRNVAPAMRRPDYRARALELQGRLNQIQRDYDRLEAKEK